MRFCSSVLPVSQLIVLPSRALVGAPASDTSVETLPPHDVSRRSCALHVQVRDYILYPRLMLIISKPNGPLDAAATQNTSAPSSPHSGRSFAAHQRRQRNRRSFESTLTAAPSRRRPWERARWTRR
ncbi:hypothetical protein B0H15DRAFT_833010 [Mycena belliarum]|uniref:Secreted protein n=1 Tax=Mycena belliarum TaxID=1033014 RepID=A0AAD6UBT2_9AGAR|nr:hypothetical protein B0H15DRAFT_833010 [Mycena belliae]